MQTDEGMALGKDLHPDDVSHVLRAYVHRYTMSHVPQWATNPRPNGKPYRPHFLDDADWLAHTEFKVRKNGRLDRRARACRSYPTWPVGVE